MKSRIVFGMAGILFAGAALAAGVDLMQGYRDAGAGPFSAEAGGSAWTQTHQSAGAAGARSCASCHGTDPGQPGKHIETGKPIEPMAVSVNPARLSDPGKVEKWFRRNCRWTLGRECTPQEKGDFIQYMTSQ
ncbi:MAG: DUF1924 domain-containing protein [Gammaproteobacteria bacterium]